MQETFPEREQQVEKALMWNECSIPEKEQESLTTNQIRSYH